MARFPASSSLLLAAAAGLLIAAAPVRAAEAAAAERAEAGCRGSVPRLKPPRREDLEPAERVIFDRLMATDADTRRGASGPGKGLAGPLGIFLHSPQLAELSGDLNWHLRFESQLDDRTREVAILVVAREVRSAFEWAAHEPIARRVGVPEATIAAIRDGSALEGVDQQDALIIRLGREAIADRRVSQATFDIAYARFGARRLVNLVGLMGQYDATALMLATFDLQPSPAEGCAPRRTQ